MPIHSEGVTFAKAALRPEDNFSCNLHAKCRDPILNSIIIVKICLLNVFRLKIADNQGAIDSLVRTSLSGSGPIKQVQFL